MINVAIVVLILGTFGTGVNSQNLISWNKLKMFVDELPDIPKLYGYKVVGGKAVPTYLKIGMFQKNWVSSSSLLLLFL